MRLGLSTRGVFKPSSISMLAVLASLVAWLLPSFGVLKKGYENRSHLDAYAVVVLLCWYLLIFSAFFLGQKAGALSAAWQRRHPLPPAVDLDSDLIYGVLTVVTALGLGTMLQTIFTHMSLAQAALFISLGQTNALKDSIYEDYHIGLVSFRYTVLYPASIALYRIIRHRRYSLINLANVLMLAASAFLSSRLILIAALVATAYLVTYGKPYIRFRPFRVLVVVGVIFLILSVLNVSRNAAFYDRNKLSFGLAGVNEIVAYLGTPFQVAIGSVRIMDVLGSEGLGDPTHQSEPYRGYIDIGVNYNTNSAFVALHEKMGYWCWPYIGLLCLFMGWFFTVLAAFGKSALLLPAGAILYAACELWRLDLFEQGTFVIWMVTGFGVPALVACSSYIWNGWRAIYRERTSLGNHTRSM